MCSILYIFKERLIDELDQPSFLTKVKQDIFDPRIQVDQKDNNVIKYVRENMLSHPKPFKKVKLGIFKLLKQQHTIIFWF